MEIDWQINFSEMKDRSQYLLQSEKLADCRFLVGTSPNQSLIAGHRLLLAMTSPVFERMLFYGNLPEKNDPIFIPDIQPDAFKAMLDYIYSDCINIASFDEACELYYVAKKYMLLHLVEHCTNFLLADLTPKNACRAYEFATLHEDTRLMESSMELIAFNTLQVIADPSFMDIEFSTLMAILDQNRLNIDSELDLFNCLLKLANKRGILNDGDKDNKFENGNENADDVVVVEENKLDPENSNSGAASTLAGTCGNVSNVADEVVEVYSSASAFGKAGESTADIRNIMDGKRNRIDEAMLRQAVKKIRFLTMTPEQFAEGPGRSKFLKQNEALAILTELISPTINDWPMPEGFSQLGNRDKKLKRYCISFCPIFKIESTDYDSCLVFKVNTNISLLGVQIKLQHSYLRNDIKGFSACIQNMQGSEIACTSSIESKIDRIFELTFNSPVFIHRNQNYNIKIFNNHGYSIQMYSWNPEIDCNGCKFNILEADASKKILYSIIKGIVFVTQQDLSCNLTKYS